MTETVRQDDEQLLTLSANAVKRIKVLLAGEKEEDPQHDYRFRIQVDAGGCYGFQYHFTFDHQSNEDDVIYRVEDIEVIIDQTSLDVLGQAQLDYVEELIGSAFQLKIANASSSCGCGSSFSV